MGELVEHGLEDHKETATIWEHITRGYSATNTRDEDRVDMDFEDSDEAGKYFVKGGGRPCPQLCGGQTALAIARGVRRVRGYSDRERMRLPATQGRVAGKPLRVPGCAKFMGST